MRLSDVRDGLWFFDRAKTNNSSLGKPLLPECLAIIQKYANPKNKYVFDFILGDKYDKSDKAINERKRDVTSNLRDWYVKISEELGFEGHFSFYTARYTSATISANKGADMRAVQANLSHSSLTTTEIYSQFRNEDAMRESLELLRVRTFQASEAGSFSRLMKKFFLQFRKTQLQKRIQKEPLWSVGGRQMERLHLSISLVPIPFLKS